jgi:hypothetical protein
VKSDLTCADRGKVSSSRVLAFTTSGGWLDVMSASSGANVGVRSVRYRPLFGPSPALPEGLAEFLRAQASSIERARAAVASRVRVSDVGLASKHVDAKAVQGWLVANGEPFELDAKALVALADTGVPGEVVDVMIALTYPQTFSLQAQQVARRQPPARVPSSGSGGGPTCISMLGLPAVDPMDCGWNLTSGYPGLIGGDGLLCLPTSSAPTGWLRCSTGRGVYMADFSYLHPLYGYPYRYLPADETWYMGQSPFVVVPNGGGPSQASAPGHGRVVNGRGYTQGGASESSGSPSASSSASPVPTYTPQSSGGESSAPAPAPAPSSGGERTAHPR